MRHVTTLISVATLARQTVIGFCKLSFILRTVVLGVVTLFVSGAAHAIAQPARDASDSTIDLVEALVEEKASVDQVPAAFVDEMGYVPDSVSGTLRHPRGGCSTPGQMGPDRFTQACQTHDLGYDILRYADTEHHRLSAKARLVIDWHLYQDLIESCETPACSVTATAYYTAVSANSIRQGFKTPHEEPTTPWIVIAAAVVGLSAAGNMFRGDVDADSGG